MDDVLIKYKLIINFILQPRLGLNKVTICYISVFQLIALN